MTVLCVDTETSIYNNGSPFDPRNKLICFSWANEDSSGASQVTENNLADFASRLAGCTVFVGFNAKFDLHWLRRIGLRLPAGCRVFDTQSAEFVRSNQKLRYPSLEGALIAHDLGHKTDIVKTEYWDKGIQTEDVPWEILSEYAENDAVKTYELYKRQLEVMTPDQIRLTWLMGFDLLILEEMEWNGLKFDEDLCETRAEEIKREIHEISEQLSRVYPDVPINFSSGDHLSAFLYGGTITEVRKEHVGFFKSGQRVGEPKYRNVEIKHELPRLVEPLPRSELKKEGFFATNADTLLKLKPSKKTRGIIELIQKQTRLETLLSKTYNGLIKVRREQMWNPGELHGQFNQVTVSTGRLSSSGPNLQNLDSAAQDLFISRYID